MIKIIKKTLSLIVLLTPALGWGMDSSSSQDETSGSSYSSGASESSIQIAEPKIILPVTTKEEASQSEIFWPVGKDAIKGLISITPLSNYSLKIDTLPENIKKTIYSHLDSKLNAIQTSQLSCTIVIPAMPLPEDIWKIIWGQLDDSAKLRIGLVSKQLYETIGKPMLKYMGEIRLCSVESKLRELFKTIEDKPNAKNKLSTFDDFCLHSQKIYSLDKEITAEYFLPIEDNKSKQKKSKVIASVDRQLFDGTHLKGISDRASAILMGYQPEAGKYLKLIEPTDSASDLLAKPAEKSKYMELCQIYKHNSSFANKQNALVVQQQSESCCTPLTLCCTDSYEGCSSSCNSCCDDFCCCCCTNDCLCCCGMICLAPFLLTHFLNMFAGNN